LLAELVSRFKLSGDQAASGKRPGSRLALR